MHLNYLVHSLDPAKSPALHLVLLRWATLFQFLFTRSPDWTAISPAHLLCGLISCTMQGCPLSRPYQNTDATGQAGMQTDRHFHDGSRNQQNVKEQRKQRNASGRL